MYIFLAYFQAELRQRGLKLLYIVEVLKKSADFENKLRKMYSIYLSSPVDQCYPKQTVYL